MQSGFKIVILGLMAVLLSAVVASSAQAADEFTVGSYPSTIRGSQEGLTSSNYFEVTGNKDHCERVEYQATLSGPSKELTVTPHIAGCLATGFELSLTPTLNGCAFTFKATGTSGANVIGTTSVVCPAGKQIELHLGSLCTIDIPAQSDLAGLTFVNKGGSTVTVSINLTQLTFIETKPSIFCPFTNGADTLGSWVSSVTLNCYEDPGGTETGPTGVNTTYKAGGARNCHVA